MGSDDGEPFVAPAMGSEKGLKSDIVGLEATGFAINVLSASLILIFFSELNQRLSKKHTELRPSRFFASSSSNPKITSFPKKQLKNFTSKHISLSFYF